MSAQNSFNINISFALDWTNTNFPKETSISGVETSNLPFAFIVCFFYIYYDIKTNPYTYSSYKYFFLIPDHCDKVVCLCFEMQFLSGSGQLNVNALNFRIKSLLYDLHRSIKKVVNFFIRKNRREDFWINLRLYLSVNMQTATKELCLI